MDELCRVCVEEVERVRVLFRWVSTKNLAMLDVEAGVPPETFLGTLRAVKYGVRSYHELFKRLCHYAGIMCEIVHGYSKGAGYTPGTPTPTRITCFDRRLLFNSSYSYIPIALLAYFAQFSPTFDLLSTRTTRESY